MQEALEEAQCWGVWGMNPRFEGQGSSRETASAPLRLVGHANPQSAALSPLGQDLRKARQSKGLEISEISSSLKISKRHLNAIEESNLDALPLGDVYLISYARDYARYLGLNTAQCVEKLKNEIAEHKSRGQANTAQPHKHRLPVAIGRFFGFGDYKL